MAHLLCHATISLLLRAEVVVDRVRALPVVLLLLQTYETIPDPLIIIQHCLVLLLGQDCLRAILAHAAIDRLQIGQALW